jgi:hypothetical protein
MSRHNVVKAAGRNTGCDSPITERSIHTVGGIGQGGDQIILARQPLSLTQARVTATVAKNQATALQAGLTAKAKRCRNARMQRSSMNWDAVSNVRQPSFC